MPDTGQTQEKAKEVAGQAQERVQGAAQQAKGRMREQVDQRSTQAGEQVNTVARDVRAVAEELRTQGKDKPAQYAEQAADRVERAGQWLEQKSGDELLQDVEDFARRNPWAIAAGGLMLGLAAGRLLKASSRERYQASYVNDTYAATGRYGREPYAGGADAEATSRERAELLRDEGSTISTGPRT